MRNFTILYFTATTILLSPIFSKAQVGINTTDPKGILDIVSTNSALILSRIANPDTNISTNSQAGMILFDTTNKTIRYYDGTAWNTVLYTDALQTNEGVVKLNSSGGVKPVFNFVNSGTPAIKRFYPIKYTSTIVNSDFSAAPTTSWPENIINPTAANFYYTDASSRGRFLENPIGGQVHTWRVIVSYSGKTNGAVAYVTIKLSNPDSGFTIDQTSVAPNGVTSGNLVFYLMTIADGASIGKGYTLEILSDTAMNTTIDSVTRISANKD